MARPLWAFLFAGLIVVLRMATLVLTNDSFDSGYALGVLLSFFPEFLLASLLSLLVFAPDREKSKSELRTEKKRAKKEGREPRSTKPFNILKLTGWICVLAFGVLALFSSHYEAAFGRLPSPQLFYYLKELAHLKSSVTANTPIGSLIVEGLILFGGLIFAYRKLRGDESENRFRTLERGMLFVGLAVAVLGQLHFEVLASRFGQGIKTPFTFTLRNIVFEFEYRSDKTKVTQESIWTYQKLLGHDRPPGGVNPKYPLCGFHENDPGKADGRSVIFIIMEGVGVSEMEQKIGGKELMPNLRRIAEENVRFKNFFSTGTKSNQAMPAVFAGLPAQTYQNILWREPVLRMNGFPKTLSQEGYSTAYFHGSDLSFEHQREFLQNVGFKNIFEYDPKSDMKIYGWGYDDRAMFKKFTSWIEEQRAQDAQRPFLATLFTLSTHDPYVLPPDWKPVFSQHRVRLRSTSDWSLLGRVDRKLAARESFHFLDRELGKFYKWYLANEKPKETLLAILGDHAPHLYNMSTEAETGHMRFRVPFILAGLNASEQARASKTHMRLATMHDLPATFLGALGMKPHYCNQGFDLLKEEDWPKDRIVYSVGGETLGRIYFWQNTVQGYASRKQGKLQLIDFESIGTVTGSKRSYVQRFKKLAVVMFGLNRYLITENAYFPREEEIQAQEIKVEKTIYVSHRGNTNGESQTGAPRENSLAALDAVVRSKFDWVEIDIQMTKDGKAVLLHDPELLVNGMKQKVFSFTLNQLRKMPQLKHIPTLKNVFELYGDRLNFLIEAKPQKFISYSLAIVREVVRLVRENKERNPSKRAIIDSFSSQQISSIKAYCPECETGMDMPYRKEVTDEYLDFAQELDMNWIYVHFSQVNDDLIGRARSRGLRVMAYPVNDKNEMNHWGSIRPAGIITDSEKIITQ